jgi:ribokinase
VRARILVAGSANMDLVVTVERRPGAGETVLGGDTVIGPGGKGANTAATAARLGADVALLAAVGTDAYGDELLSTLRAAGVDTAPVLRRERPTGIAYITLTPDGENSILVSPGANAELTVDVGTALDEADLLVLSLEIPTRAVERLLLAAKGRTVLNLSPVGPISTEALAAVDVLLVNQHEAAWLLGAPLERPEDARKLLDRGPKAAVVTLGGDGAVVVTAERTEAVSAPKTEVVDTTGAGDAFAGALATALAQGADLVEAARAAAQVAASCVSRPGAQATHLGPADLAPRLSTLTRRLGHQS